MVQAAVLRVPFVDVVSTMSDPTLPATVTEYEVSASHTSKEKCCYLLLRWAHYSLFRVCNVATLVCPAAMSSVHHAVQAPRSTEAQLMT